LVENAGSMVTPSKPRSLLVQSGPGGFETVVAVPLRELSDRSDEVYVLFNNNRWSKAPGGELWAQAPTNSSALRGILADSGVPTG
jgi:hypothetical protein